MKDLFLDLRDGTRLLSLLEVLTNRTFVRKKYSFGSNFAGYMLTVTNQYELTCRNGKKGECVSTI